jgi:N-acylneuraminate cytidylyltransferase
MNVAYIPVRAGSKSIPRKNIKFIAGKPLIYWSMKAASECSDIQQIYVCTDSEEIANTAVSFGFDKCQVIGRSSESASDTASTEFGMLEFADEYQFDNIVLIQATSPLIEARDLTLGFRQLVNGADSVLSVANQRRFIWREDINGYYVPVNYNIRKRPLRQEFDGFLVENGAFYITSKEYLLKYKCRLSGNVKIVRMAEESYVELDEPYDWCFVEQCLISRKLNR